MQTSSKAEQNSWAAARVINMVGMFCQWASSQLLNRSATLTSS